MNWFYRWLRNKMHSLDVEKTNRIYATEPISSMAQSLSHRESGMNFTVYRANGGYVIQYNQYDKRSDRADSKLHIITDDKTLGEEIGKIISFESLRS